MTLEVELGKVKLRRGELRKVELWKTLSVIAGSTSVVLASNFLHPTSDSLLELVA